MLSSVIKVSRKKTWKARAKRTLPVSEGKRKEIRNAEKHEAEDVVTRKPVKEGMNLKSPFFPIYASTRKKNSWEIRDARAHETKERGRKAK